MRKSVKIKYDIFFQKQIFISLKFKIIYASINWLLEASTYNERTHDESIMHAYMHKNKHKQKADIHNVHHHEGKLNQKVQQYIK